MNPHQKNKVDISKLSPEEQRLFRMYGKLPNRKDLLQNKMKERKYFDSGDYALSKAGKAAKDGVTTIGREHPVPENIPHSTTTQLHTHNGSLGSHAQMHHQHSGSPVKESSFLHRETSAEDMEREEQEKLARERKNNNNIKMGENQSAGTGDKGGQVVSG